MLKTRASGAVDTIITATLVRGKHRSEWDAKSGKYLRFERNVPTPVEDEDFARQLEEMAEEVSTDDGDLIEKDIFRINWNAPARTVENDGAPRRPRMRIVPVAESDEPRTPAVRRPPPGLRKAQGR